MYPIPSLPKMNALSSSISRMYPANLIKKDATRLALTSYVVMQITSPTSLVTNEPTYECKCLMYDCSMPATVILNWAQSGNAYWTSLCDACHANLQRGLNISRIPMSLSSRVAYYKRVAIVLAITHSRNCLTIVERSPFDFAKCI